MKCPKCKGELTREGYIGAWFQLRDDGSNDFVNDFNVETQNNLWKNQPDKQKWICYNCGYEEEIKEDEV